MGVFFLSPSFLIRFVRFYLGYTVYTVYILVAVGLSFALLTESGQATEKDRKSEQRREKEGLEGGGGIQLSDGGRNRLEQREAERDEGSFLFISGFGIQISTMEK